MFPSLLCETLQAHAEVCFLGYEDQKEIPTDVKERWPGPSSGEPPSRSGSKSDFYFSSQNDVLVCLFHPLLSCRVVVSMVVFKASVVLVCNRRRFPVDFN